jgi:hypothetical protein
MIRFLSLSLALFLFQAQQPAQPPTPIPSTHLKTKWAADVNPDHPLPEYPRPQMERKQWVNLNGPWEYTITATDAPVPSAFGKRIIVPYPVESQLSQAGEWVAPNQRLWYHRVFTAPAASAGSRVLLNFGAVDWEAEVFVNGSSVGSHQGGYDPFTFDITSALKPGSQSQDLVVAVRDPTDEGQQPRGKQVRRPRSIFYTEVTGIWQTVWLETVPALHVTELQIQPELDRNQVHVVVRTDGPRDANAPISVVVLDNGREVSRAGGRGPTTMNPFTLPLPNAHKWSTTDPFLYTLRVTAGSDEVNSYFGMRSIAVRADASGARRLFLNGEPIFQFGPLDQGWWPDGLYTAPTDEALAFDITETQALGFNVIRKHVKVEPARWYYHADRLGMLVWQDMPSGDNKGPEGEANYFRELQTVIAALRNHPSIVMWVPFNEGWGQHQTEKVVDWIKSTDPTRLVNNTSGWTDMNVGDVADLHSYPGPGIPPMEATRSRVLGEFGGLGLPIEGHTWVDKGNWGYRSYTSLDDLNVAYRDLIAQLRIHQGDGLAAAIYTQTTDCEIEVNGVMTYDRAVIKLSPESIAANKTLYTPAPKVTHLVPAADRAPQAWRYTTTTPADTWMQPSFDAGAWSEGQSGFGAKDTRFARVATEWKSGDIWLRRTVTLAAAPQTLHLRVFHDDDAEVYLNGVLAAKLTGANSSYSYIPLSTDARSALRPGPVVIAVHAHQNRGGQFIDVGLADVVQPPAAR